MILLSLNVRGVRGTPKFHILKRLIERIAPNVILIQETMVEGSKVWEVFTKLLGGWTIYSMDALGQSGGFLTAWNPSKVSFKPFLTTDGILLDGYSMELNRNLNIINCYGPYVSRKDFWDEVMEAGILGLEKLIFLGDLNFTLFAA